jgi:YVTN family beta-propeller protein
MGLRCARCLSAPPPASRPSEAVAQNALLAGLKRRRRRRASGIVACAAVVAAVSLIVPALTGARSTTPAPATPTGTPTVYVANRPSGPSGPGWVTPISTATNTAGPRVNVGPSYLMAATPNGKTVYVASLSSDTVIPISTATNTAGRPIKVARFPFAITITPDGKIAYVQSENSRLTPIMTATNTARPADHDKSRCGLQRRRLACDHTRRKDHLCFPSSQSDGAGCLRRAPGTGNPQTSGCPGVGQSCRLLRK